jgi:hypothetical protein
VRSVTGDLFFEGGDAICGDSSRRTPFDYFMAMLPLDALMRVVTLTSEKIREKGKDLTTDGRF